jgi:hypothetical protein
VSQPGTNTHSATHPGLTVAFQVPFQANTALVPDIIGAQNVPNTTVLLSDPDAITTFLLEELNVDMADSIKPYLWIAGLRFSKIRPLHRNNVIRREIVICEQAALHLVSRNEVIFIKPIPHCLLQHTFYREYVAGKRIEPKIKCRAPAFLATYLRLIRHQSDFSIAIQFRLIPSWVTWEQWLTFSADLETALSDSQGRMMSFDGRYSYGELRLTRLNFIMRVFKGVPRGYVILDTQYSNYFAGFFSLLVLITAVYTSVALSAFQVALASPLATHGLTYAGFWFSIITLFLLAALIGFPVIWFVVALVDNLIFAFRSRS